MQICKYSYSDTNLKMPIITCATGALFRAMAVCSYKDNICTKFCTLALNFAPLGDVQHCATHYTGKCQHNKSPAASAVNPKLVHKSSKKPVATFLLLWLAKCTVLTECSMHASYMT